MDVTDGLIIDFLRRDGRAAYAVIGESVGLSASAVKRRMDKLLAEGSIQGFTVQTRMREREAHIEAYLEIFCSGTVGPAALRQILESVPEVRSAGTVTGHADAIVRMVAPTIAALERAIEEIRLAANIDHTVSAIVLTPILDRT